MCRVFPVSTFSLFRLGPPPEWGMVVGALRHDALLQRSVCCIAASPMNHTASPVHHTASPMHHTASPMHHTASPVHRSIPHASRHPPCISASPMHHTASPLRPLRRCRCFCVTRISSILVIFISYRKCWSPMPAAPCMHYTKPHTPRQPSLNAPLYGHSTISVGLCVCVCVCVCV